MIDPEPAKSTGMVGLEPSLDELLSDQIAIALMRADRVTVEDVRQVASNAKRRLKARRRRPTPPGMCNDTAPAGIGHPSISALALQDDACLARLGLRRDQVARLRIVGPADVAEVGRMLVHVGLDQEVSLPLPVRVDLHLTCAGCTERPRCLPWFAAGEADDGYRMFCPNVPMFDRMRQVQRWRYTPLHPSDNPSKDGWIESMAA